MQLRALAAAAAIAVTIGQCAMAAGSMREEIAAARARHAIPAIGFLSRVKGQDEAIAVGVRALGDPTPATTEDRWHIGSDTKAFTATLVARMVEAGELRFEETLAEALPD